MFHILAIPVAAALIIMAFVTLEARHQKAAALLIACVLVSTLMSMIYAIADAFTGEGLNAAVVFHLLHGLNKENTIGIAQFPWLTALTISVLIAIGAWAIASWRAVRRRPLAARSSFTRISTCTSLLASVAVAIPLHPMVIEGRELWDSLAPEHSNILSQELKAIPGDLRPRAKPLSFVYIYAESMERAFLDAKAFPGLSSNLSALESASLSFRGIGEAPFTNWTVAGMVSSQCAMPLAPITRKNADFTAPGQDFIPGADCLGDVLQQWGYRLAFIGGADLTFAGKGNFYKSHGFHEVTGLNEIGSIIGAGFETSKWGAYDQDVFKAALTKFRRLKKQDTPFGLFVLTTTTHPPSGFPSPSCQESYGTGDNKMLNAMMCSDREIAAFITELERDGSDEMLIFVASDHLQMGSGAAPLFSSMGLVRENTLFVRGLTQTGTVERAATTMDVAPTVLAMITGSPVEAMALGRDLRGDGPTLTEKYGRDEFYRMIERWRTDLWRTHVPASRMPAATSHSTD